MNIKHKIILFWLVCCSFSAATAQNVIHPNIKGPSGLSVNAYNGVLFFSRTDLLSQNTLQPMSLQFYYNSSKASADYGYGLGFSLSYEMRYRLNTAGDVTIECGNGRSDTYVRFGDDYEAPKGVFSVLTLENDQFVLTEKDGTKYRFGNMKYGKVTAITDRNGNQTTLTYTDSLLTKIEDRFGHSITLTYTDGLLTKATASFVEGSVSYEYDGLHRLKKRTDVMGNNFIYDYDRFDRINEMTDANGNKTLMAYNVNGMCSRMKTDVSDKSIRYEEDRTVFIDYTTPTNLYSYYRWDEKGRAVERAGACCGSEGRLEYDNDDNLVRVTDANGNVTSYTYDERGNMLSLTDALGNTERYTYDTFNQVTSMQDKNGNTFQFTYDNKGNMTAFNGPLDIGTAYTYNEYGWPLTVTDGNGNVTVNEYNADGTLRRVTDAAGYTVSFGYNQYGQNTSATDALGNTVTYAYNKNGQLTIQTDPLGNTSTLSYDKMGNVVRVKNAKNQISAYTYDAEYNMLTITDPKGGVVSFTYDGKGNMTSVTDPLGNTERFVYDWKGNLLSETNAEGETTTYEYDVNGNRTALFQPNGNVIQFFYDRMDRPVQLSDNIGLIAKFTYDANGNSLSVTDAEGNVTTGTYDALNRPTSIAYPSGTSIVCEYDANSNITKVTLPNGSDISYTYSSRNEKLTETDALGATTKFEYDGNGNLVKATDAKGNATAYTYDMLDRNTAITFADGLSMQYAYDELGRITTSKDRAGRETRYAYDALGNLLSRTYADGTSDRYTYDAMSQMLTAVNKDATVSFTYDKAGRILSETLAPQGGSQGTTAYSYDLAANKRTITYPHGMRVEQRLNARSLIASILQDGNEVVRMDYNSQGMKTRQTYANGIATDYGYNENGWITSIKAAKGNAEGQQPSLIMGLELVYDAMGNITQQRNLSDNERTETYEYDLANQLTSFLRGSKVSKSYEFDKVGNRIKTLENGTATHYTANNVNALTAVSGGQNIAPKYDDNGNLVSDGQHTYSYDLGNREVGVDGQPTSVYDALGRRIVKGSCYCYYMGDVIVEEVEGGEVTAFIYGNAVDELLKTVKGSEEYYFHTNHLNSVMCLTDEQGEVVEYMDYDVYGTPTFYDAQGQPMERSSVGNDRLFCGREYNYATGMYYYRARTMNPMLGRFMQKDPLMYINGMNDYAYTMNNPVVFADPNGTEVITATLVLATFVMANVSAWSAYYKNGTFSPANVVGHRGRHVWDTFKNGVITFTTGVNPWLGGGIASGFGAIESWWSIDCWKWSVKNFFKNLGKIAFNTVVTGVANFISSKIGLSEGLSFWKKLGWNAVKDFTSDMATSTGNQAIDGEDITIGENLKNAAINTAIGTAAYAADGLAAMGAHDKQGIVQSSKNLVNSTADGAKKVAKKTAEGVRNYVKTVENINAPLTPSYNKVWQ